MSSPRYIWWSYVKGMIRKFPERAERLQDMKEPSAEIDLSGMPKGAGKVGRPTEQLAIAQLPPTDQKEYEAVRAALRETLGLSNGKLRIRLIQMVFWKRTHTVQGAALRLYISEKTAKRWHRSFILLVAKKAGLLTEVDPLEPKK